MTQMCSAALALVKPSLHPVLTEGPEINAFRQRGWFGTLSPQLQAEMMARATVWIVPARRNVCKQGAVPDVWFGLVSGAIGLSCMSARGAETLLDIVEPGHWFGEAALLETLAQPYTAQTLSPSIVMVMRRSALQQIFSKNPEMRPALAKLNSIVMTRLMQRLLILADKSLAARAKEYIALLSRRFCAPESSSNPGKELMSLGLTQSDWGAIFGACRQHSNAVLRQLARSGFIQLARGRIVSLERKR